MRKNPPAGARGPGAVERARALFLDDEHPYGCAETTFIVLKEAFGLRDLADSSAAMALNGGVAYSGGMCGAVTGSALAIGQLVAARSRITPRPSEPPARSCPG